MQITVSGKQIDISASFRAYVEEQLDLVVGSISTVESRQA